MKIVDTTQYVSELHKLVEDGKEMGMRIAGNSMLPFLIHERDYILFKKPDKKLRRGDMVFYKRDSGQYVMHRIWKIKPEGYYLVGDAQVEIEGPLREEQIFAVITQVKRKGRLIGPEDLWWKFFQYVWIRMVPLRHIFIKGYSIGGTTWRKIEKITKEYFLKH